MRTATAHYGKHLRPDEVIDRTDECPVCLDRAPRRPAFRIQTDPEIHLLHCGRCRAYSASHMPTPQVLDAYYNQYYDSSKQNKVTFDDVRRFAKYLARPMESRAFGAEVSILDFGGGDGSVALELARRVLSQHDTTRGVRVTLVDFQPPAACDDDRIRVDHVRTYDQIAGRYDIVLASAILEHIPDVHPVFVRLFESVAPGGFFYARTPYGVPLTRLYKNLDLTYPAHVHDMGCGFWNRVAEIFKFPGRYVVSRPSIVEHNIRADPGRALAAHVLKFPARIEGLLSPAGRKDRIWRLVGGWEVVLQRGG